VSIGDTASSPPRAPGPVRSPTCLEPAISTLGPIDRDSPLPYYHQLKELLRDEIIGGRWLPGTRLPSEPELCRALDVSRTVVRQALGDLEHEGLLRRRKGRGTFVAEPKIRGRLVQSLTGFYDDIVAQGRVPRTRVLRKGVLGATRTVAEQLGVPVGSPVVAIERLRYVDDEPVVLVTTYLPHDLVPSLERIDLADRSLYRTLASEYGLHLARGRRTLESVGASDGEAELLGIEPGEPLLYLRSVTYLDSGRAVEYYEARHRGDRSVLEVDLVRQP
jgi:GntR family transcriptional regulator